MFVPRYYTVPAKTGLWQHCVAYCHSFGGVCARMWSQREVNDVANIVRGAYAILVIQAIVRKFSAHIIASNYLQHFYSFQPTKLLLAA